MTRLDESINEDLRNLLDIGEIQKAKNIYKEIKVSTKGLPQHYTGDRDAKTVFVQLNPGINETDSNINWETKNIDSRIDYSSIGQFITTYKETCSNFKVTDPKGYDYFDLKQAAFLYSWENSGINIQTEFWNDKKYYEDVNVAVISQKLQLELIPYGSNSFKVDKNNIYVLLPFIDILLDEIFSEERRYVIFGARYFYELFKKYESELYAVEFKGKEEKIKLNGRQKYSSCNILTITNKNNNRSIKAIIANSFPDQSLSKDLKAMQQYGEKCYDIFSKSN